MTKSIAVSMRAAALVAGFALAASAQAQAPKTLTMQAR